MRSVKKFCLLQFRVLRKQHEEPNNFGFENSEFESEDRPRHLTLQNVQLHICPTVCIGCLNLSWARHYAFCYCWKAEAVVLRRTQEMVKSLSLGFYCSNYLHCCFLASRSIIHQKIAVTYFWSSYLLWLGILFEIKRRLFARCSLFVIFEKSHRNWGTKSVTREGVGSDQWFLAGKLLLCGRETLSEEI